MGVLSNPVRLLFVIAVIGQSASCRDARPKGSAATSYGPCPASPADAPLFNRVRAAYAPIELWLPQNVTARASRDSTHRAQGWAGPAGLGVTYAVHAEPMPIGDLSAGDRHVLNCVEHIGGKQATIRMHYSERTTAPSQYVVARWVLESGETLVLTTTHPDSSHRGELLSIVRSVRFIDAIP